MYVSTLELKLLVDESISWVKEKILVIIKIID